MKRIAGSRVLKTGIAIFITAWICEWIGWPPVFAVITAIVTVEPTVAQSIKKGIIRFPASAIGSFYAVLFITLFGHSALTYACAAVFTIVTTYRFKLFDGLLVATLTSVAMIEVIHDNFMASFFIRLGTTTIGLAVSTLVNMFLMPPNYQSSITNKLKKLAQDTGETIQCIFSAALSDQRQDPKMLKTLEILEERVFKIEVLINYQRDEAKYHPLTAAENNELKAVNKKLTQLKLINYHIENVYYMTSKTLDLTEQEKDMLFIHVENVSHSLQVAEDFSLEEHREQLKKLVDLFWRNQSEIIEEKPRTTAFPSHFILLYELLSIYQLVESYFTIKPEDFQKKEKAKLKQTIKRK